MSKKTTTVQHSAGKGTSSKERISAYDSYFGVLEQSKQKIPLSRIITDGLSPGKNEMDDLEETRGSVTGHAKFDRLVASLTVQPDLEYPIIVEQMGKDSYKIVDGERRYRAALKAGMKEIDCLVRTSKDVFEKRVRRARARVQHRKLSKAQEISDVSWIYYQWLEREGKKKVEEDPNVSKFPYYKEVAALLGMNESNMLEILRIAKDENAMQVMDQGYGRKAAAAVESSPQPELLMEAIQEVAQETAPRHRGIVQHPLPTDEIIEAQERAEIKAAEKEEDPIIRQDRISQEHKRKIVSAINTMSSHANTIRKELPLVSNVEDLRTIYHDLEAHEQTIREFRSQIYNSNPGIFTEGERD